MQAEYVALSSSMRDVLPFKALMVEIAACMGIKHEDEKMEAIQKNGDEMRVMIAAMQKYDAEEKTIMLNEMHSLQTQLTVVTLTCVIVSVAAFLKLKN